MDLQSLSYAVIQVVHNFGAVAVVGSAISAISALGLGSAGQGRRLAWINLLGWVSQGISGGAFGAVSWFYYGRFPDIHGIAMGALLIKIACAGTGFMLSALYLHRGKQWREGSRQLIWKLLAVLSVVALTAAAFLRWFS